MSKKDAKLRRAIKSAQKKNQRKKKKPAAKKYHAQFDPNWLTARGPIIKAIIEVAPSHKLLLQSKGLPVPKPVVARLLLDTGASSTVVSHQLAEKAGLALISENSPLHGVGVDTSGKTYFGEVCLQFRDENNKLERISKTCQISAASLPAQTSEYMDGLLGRDFLAGFEVTYNGVTGIVSFQFVGKKRPPQKNN